MLKIKTYPALEAMRHLNEVKGKFIQIKWKGDPWLLFASKDQHQFHNQIVAHFMTEQHLAHHWKSPEVLLFEDDDLEISGGGKFFINWKNKQLTLSDNSMVYGRFSDEGLSDAILGCGLPWSEFELVIS